MINSNNDIFFILIYTQILILNLILPFIKNLLK